MNQSKHILVLLGLAVLCPAVFAGCLVRVENQEAGKPKLEAKQKLEETTEAKKTPKFSSLSFLDESISIALDESFYSQEGEKIASAVFYPDSKKVLILITDYPEDETRIYPGKLYLVSKEEEYSVFELKEAERAVTLKASTNFRGAYFNIIKEPLQEPSTEGSEAEDSSEGGKLIKKSLGTSSSDSEKSKAKGAQDLASAEPYLELRFLNEKGKVENKEMKNLLLREVLADGSLLLERIESVTSSGKGYSFSSAGEFVVMSAGEKEPKKKLSFEPKLSPKLTRALKIETLYDPSNYENSYFRVLLATLADSEAITKPDASLKEIYRTAYFLTFQEHRWTPQALFMDEDTIFLTMFTLEPDTEKSALSQTSGKLELVLFNVNDLSKKTILPDISPYTRIYYFPNHPVFFTRTLVPNGENWQVELRVHSIDGKVSRLLYTSSQAEEVELCDVSFEDGALLFLEQVPEKGYSFLGVLRLSLEKKKGYQGKPPSEDLSPSPEEPFGESPPPIRVPSKKA